MQLGVAAVQTIDVLAGGVFIEHVRGLLSMAGCNLTHLLARKMLTQQNAAFCAALVQDTQAIVVDSGSKIYVAYRG